MSKEAPMLKSQINPPSPSFFKGGNLPSFKKRGGGRFYLGQLEIRALRNFPKGQGLLEAVIALGIIITGIVAALTLAVASLSAGVAGESRIIAANLAREGVEIVRNIRDSNWVAERNWDVGFDTTKTYTLTWNEATKKIELLSIANVSSRESFRVYHLPTSAIYTADITGNERTSFFRGITLSDICKDSATVLCPSDRIGIRVKSQVGWERRGVLPTTPQVEVIADLYKWR